MPAARKLFIFLWAHSFVDNPSASLRTGFECKISSKRSCIHIHCAFLIDFAFELAAQLSVLGDLSMGVLNYGCQSFGFVQDRPRMQMGEAV